MDDYEAAEPVTAWNDPPAAFPAVCAHQLFETQAALTPQAVAVVCGDRRLSYDELNRRANKLAHFLRKRDVGPEVLVGVCFQRTPEMVVALLAVWKAGGAYLPLDPTYPSERLSFMMDDAKPRILLTEKNHLQIAASCEREPICIDSDWQMIDGESSENPVPVAIPSNLAYVMYTSGSTGRPKGAMIVHHGLVNYLWWAIAAYGAGSGCPVPVHTSLSFDLTVTSLFTPLLSGGAVELLPEDFGAMNLLAALRGTADRGLVKLTPAHLALLNQQLSQVDAAGMTRAFVIGGENLLAENLELWRGLAFPPRLINEYGPTETVVGCCVHEVGRDDPKSGTVPIGRPIANTQLYVLDSELRPLPTGEVGELYIGGAGVARGYLNRPDLTAERFIADPFSGIPGARLYKSGDLARRRKDGILECLGRADHQVKIHGYRVELGEIEAVLAAHNLSRASAVLARDDDHGTKQLVAYLVPRDGHVANVEALRKALRTSLPEHMVPTRFVFLDALPLTPNGKVDREALAAYSTGTAGIGAGGPPRSDTEKTIAAIWKEVLQIEDVGIHDVFFDLGDSLNAIELVEQMDATFGTSLNLANLFDQSTIAALAEYVDALMLVAPESRPESQPESRPSTQTRVEEFDL